jgi:hypothetical protein
MARTKRTAASQGQPGGKDEGFQLTTLGEPNEVQEETLPAASPAALPAATKPRRRTSTGKDPGPAQAPGPRAEHRWPEPVHTEVGCPACDHGVFLVHTRDGMELLLEKQRRLIVFSGTYTEHSYTDPDTGEEAVAQLPVNGMSLWEESTNRLVLGRPATEEERGHFNAHKSLDGVAPWTIGHEGHLKHCRRLDVWMSWAAAIRKASMNTDMDGRAYYRLSISQAQSMAKDGAEASS